MSTLLVSRSCQPEGQKLVELARENGWKHQWVNRRCPPRHLHGQEFAFYGETDLARHIVRRHALALIEPTFDLMASLPHKYSKREIRFMSLGEALLLQHRAFVKPADCTNKCFDASVWEAGRYIYCDDNLPRATPVLVSEPVSWTTEYRLIVMERRVITFSPYIRNGWLARNSEGNWPYPPREAEQVLEFARDLLADDTVSLPPVVTLDIGWIDEHGLAVVEFNPVWCSGLLGCDLSSMLTVLLRACRRQRDVSEADLEWVIGR